MRKKPYLSLYIFIDIIISLFLVWYIGNENFFEFEVDIKIVCSLTLIISIYVILSFIHLRMKSFLLTFVFFIIYFVCMFGRAIPYYLFDYKSDIYFDMFAIFSEESISKALILSMLCGLFTHIGALVYSNFKGNTKIIENEVISKQSNNALEVTGLTLLFITIIPAGYFWSLRTINSLSGISNELNYGFSAILPRVADMIIIPILILMVVYKSKKILIFGIVYYGTQLFWGGRGEPILLILTLMFAYYKTVKPFNLKPAKLLFALLGIYLLSNLFVVIKVMRSEPLSEWISTFFGVYIESLANNNPIIDIAYELGVAIAPSASIMSLVPEELSYQYGLSILYSILLSIPDVFGIRPEFIETKGHIAVWVSDRYGSSFGGSIIQDAYLNFGWLAPLFFLVFGYFLSKLSTIFMHAVKVDRIIFMSLLIYPLMWLVRNSLAGFFYSVFNNLVIPLLMYIVIRKFVKFDKFLSRGRKP